MVSVFVCTFFWSVLTPKTKGSITWEITRIILNFKQKKTFQTTVTDCCDNFIANNKRINTRIFICKAVSSTFNNTHLQTKRGIYIVKSTENSPPKKKITRFKFLIFSKFNFSKKKNDTQTKCNQITIS